VYFFRHQDKHDKKLENAENGMETRSQVAINILDSLNNNKKENVNPNEKNEKVIHYRIIYLLFKIEFYNYNLF